VVIGAIGHYVRSFFQTVGSLIWLLIDMISEVGDHLARGRLPFRRHIFFEQTERAGLGSVPLVCMVCFFLGLTMALLTGYQLRTFGTERLVPGLITIAFWRELGPLMTGIILAARIGAAYTAELGTMTVSEEVEAIEAMGLGPLLFLVAPRLSALVMLMPCLVVIANLAALLGTYMICQISFNINGENFIDLVVEALILKDVVLGMAKSILFALIIALIACYSGLTVKGGAAGVGAATTSSVVITITTVIGFDTFLNMLQVNVLGN
jgi:phospholipid/cholesterol/gamma-HCH transport system permease protein